MLYSEKLFPLMVTFAETHVRTPSPPEKNSFIETERFSEF